MKYDEFKETVRKNGYRTMETRFSFSLNNMEAELEKLLSQIQTVITFCKSYLKKSTKTRFNIFYGDGNRIRMVLHRPDGKKKYLGLKDLDRAHSIAQKNYYIDVLEALEKEAEAISRFLKVHKSLNLTDILQADESGKPDNMIISPISLPYAEEAVLWSQEPYEVNPAYPEYLKHVTLNGEKVRSKSEANFANTLKARGFFYKYEKELYLDGFGYVYPDFTVFNPKNGKIYYIEHLGAIDDSKYVMSNIPKFIAYGQNGIRLNENLFVTYETYNEPLTQKAIDDVLERIENAA